MFWAGATISGLTRSLTSPRVPRRVLPAVRRLGAAGAIPQPSGVVRRPADRQHVPGRPRAAHPLGRARAMRVRLGVVVAAVADDQPMVVPDDRVEVRVRGREPARIVLDQRHRDEVGAALQDRAVDGLEDARIGRVRGGAEVGRDVDEPGAVRDALVRGAAPDRDRGGPADVADGRAVVVSPRECGQDSPVELTR